ncbi:hypothetical protein DACRYDRAFT_109028 [Dacryopinax primogenitus]|uniref:Uncharacterized protein n=1 Tax=Dacryopinax primogenitus (strain DJM 731) TaxID=1858805 RepID=M5FX40_DACPD|nr:uncharacterized protein DACRYDRAFT_109028 [Dacryopinax primogenitus]EJU00290.1 hypothetical protein DACRYDRAFT_109028 [Dacryopinax primogenitus]
MPDARDIILPPLSAGAAHMMVFGSPENFSAIVQIVAAERLEGKEPADWILELSDGEWAFRTTGS